MKDGVRTASSLISSKFFTFSFPCTMHEQNNVLKRQSEILDLFYLVNPVITVIATRGAVAGGQGQKLSKNIQSRREILEILQLCQDFGKKFEF